VSIDSAVSSPAYARFTRRVQAVMIDSIVLLVIMAGALLIAVAFQSNNIARILGVTVVLTWLLYEPLLVSLTGSTLGHLYCNMRVIDNRSGGNVSFVKAVARVIIKTFLGAYSFVTMAATSRHQALHDILTRSTVQIRNIEKAKPHHFATARIPLPADAPSRGRRFAVIVIYIVAWFIFFTAAYAILLEAGVISTSCVDYGRCGTAERWIELILNLVALGGCALLLGLGWRGRLWGARLRQPGIATP
jgi:uncharacterized RDD family membrane protein YckC